MKYIFKCTTCLTPLSRNICESEFSRTGFVSVENIRHIIFEVEQRIMDKHVANCPICGKPAQRVYTPIIHYFNDCLYHMDGSKQDSSELPTVYGGMNKFFSGF